MHGNRKIGSIITADKMCVGLQVQIYLYYINEVLLGVERSDPLCMIR